MNAFRPGVQQMLRDDAGAGDSAGAARACGAASSSRSAEGKAMRRLRGIFSRIALIAGTAGAAGGGDARGTAGAGARAAGRAAVTATPAVHHDNGRRRCWRSSAWSVGLVARRMGVRRHRRAAGRHRRIHWRRDARPQEPAAGVAAAYAGLRGWAAPLGRTYGQAPEPAPSPDRGVATNRRARTARHGAGMDGARRNGAGCHRRSHAGPDSADGRGAGGSRYDRRVLAAGRHARVTASRRRGPGGGHR